jgi:hypothetical protein
LRLRSDIWVSAFLRRCNSEGMAAALRKRGAAEAGAIFILIDRLDQTCALYGPAPQSEVPDADAAQGVERRWSRLHKAECITPPEAEARLAKEARFDADLWVVEVEDRQGRALFDVAG